MPDERNKNELLQHLEDEMGEERAQQMYSQLPDHVNTVEEFREYVATHSDSLDVLGEKDTEGGDTQPDSEPVVRDEEEVALEKVFRAAQPLVAEFSKSQEKQKQIEKEQREEELRFQQEQHKEELDHHERARREWLILVGVILLMVFVLVLFFGWRSMDVGLQLFRTILVAIISGLGGYGLGKERGRNS